MQFINLSCPCSLQALHNKLIATKASQGESNVETGDNFWHSDDEIVNAVWTLVRVSASDEADSMRLLASDFLSRVSVILVCSQYLLLCKFEYLVSLSFILTVGWYWGPPHCCFPSSWGVRIHA